MEKESKQLEMLKGNIVKDVEVGKVMTKEKGEKEVANFSIAIKEGEGTKFINCEAWEKNIDKVKDLKKGDFVELNGVSKEEYTTAKGEKKQDFNVYDATSLNKTIKGNLGVDPIIKNVNEKEVANFSIAYKEGEETKWINCQAWEKNIDKIKDLKKGDFVELKGTLGKEYGEDKKRDLIVNDSKTLKVYEGKSASTSDDLLIDGVKKGDIKSVEDALNKGANPDSIKPEHFKGVTEKTEKAIANTIDKFKLTGEIGVEKKKGNENLNKN
jgi:single-stranded DNA-binding protein